MVLTGVGVNVANSEITGTSLAMQYSLDSTNGIDGIWADASATNTTVAFTAPGNVYIREKNNPSNFRMVATVTKPTTPNPGRMQGSSGAGYTKLNGLVNDETYEYFVSSDSTVDASNAGWSGATTVSLAGSFYIDNIPATTGQHIHIRLKANNTRLASDIAHVASVNSP